MGDYRPKIEQRLLRHGARISALLMIALFQSALAPSLWRLRIDWMLIVVVIWTLIGGLGAGLRWGLIGGLSLDLLSPLPVGTHLLALLVSVLIVAAVSDILPRESRLVVLATVFGTSLIYGAIVALVMTFTGQAVVWNRYPLTILLPGALANTALALPVALIQERLHRSGRSEVLFES